MENSKKPIANPGVMLREEFDDWAVLFDPDTGDGFGLNPIGVYLWKLLDGEHSIDEMLRALLRDALDVAEDAGEQILGFVEDLTEHGLVAGDLEQVHDGRERTLPRTTGIGENLPDGGRDAGQLRSGMLPYERPRLEPLTLERPAHGSPCSFGSGDSAQCGTGSATQGSSQYSCDPTGNSAVCSGTCWCCETGNAARGGLWVCAGTGSGASGRSAGAGANCATGASGGVCNSGTLAQ